MTEALCVRVSWGDRRVATHVLHPGQVLPLSPTGEVSPDGALRFEAAPRHFAVDFHEGVVGELLRNGETPLALGEVVHRGLAVESRGGWQLELGRADVVRLARGAMRFEAFRVQAPPRAAAVLQPDYRFLNTLLVCFALFGLGVLQTQLEVPLDDSDATSSELTRMRRILVKAPPPPPPQKRAPEQSADPTPRPKKLQLGAAGTPRNASKPQKEAAGATAVQLVNGLFGGPGVGGVLGSGGLGNELRGAMGSVVSANGDGLGGMALRGSGAGGEGGDRALIGAIATSGTAKREGVGALCRGPRPCKESKGPELTSDPPMICNGCLDKELIRKVIASHRDQVRYCYELALQRSPGLAGKVSVFFMVDEAGSVPSARVEHSTVASDALGECLVSRVRSWKFPASRGSGYRVTYPFLFKPAGA